MNLKCTASAANQNLQCWKNYVEGHAQVLRDFGIEVLTSYGEDWIHNPNVYLISATDENGKTVGGIKVHKTHSEYQLPVQAAIGELAPEINQMINSASLHGAGEICGLWIAKEAGRRGLAHYLTRIAIAICPSIGVKTIFGISSPFTLNMFLSLGYEKMSALGENGDFWYPTPEFLSTAVCIEDTVLLPTADEEHRSRIFSLRVQPTQKHTENHLNIITEIEYNLSDVIA